jgi:hypothetical protein
MDGKGAWRDNVFVERLWRSVKYEEVYLRAYDTVSEARASIGRYLDFYNSRRPHSSLDGVTPDQAYFNPLPSAWQAEIPLNALSKIPGPALLPTAAYSDIATKFITPVGAIVELDVQESRELGRAGCGSHPEKRPAGQPAKRHGGATANTEPARYRPG